MLRLRAGFHMTFSNDDVILTKTPLSRNSCSNSVALQSFNRPQKSWKVHETTTRLVCRELTERFTIPVVRSPHIQRNWIFAASLLSVILFSPRVLVVVCYVGLYMHTFPSFTNIWRFNFLPFAFEIAWTLVTSFILYIFLSFVKM